MRIPKKYGQSKIVNCPFCGKSTVTKNKQDVPVCIKHKDEYLDLRCSCGEPLEVLSGKWGPYFKCMDCGNINFNKAMEMNRMQGKEYVVVKEISEDKTSEEQSESDGAQKQNGSDKSSDDAQKAKLSDKKKQVNAKPTYKAESESKKEVVIRSDELDFYF